jgi:hypothetical protein
MLSPASHQQPSAARLRRALWALEGERIEAIAAGLAGNEAYMSDLASEIADTRDAYVGHAVTEIAVLRSQLSGALQG